MAWFWNKQRALEDDLREEMESHVQEKAEAFEAQGMPPREALRAARRSFGNQALMQDRGTEVWQNRFLRALSMDFRFAFVQLRRAPFFAGAAILILALGIGANTAIFTVLYQAVFRKLPVTRPDQLAFITLMNPQDTHSNVRLSYPLLSGLASRSTDLESVSGWLQDRVMVEDGQGAQRSVNVSLVTGNAFDLLGIKPGLGRLLTPEDDQHEHPTAWSVVLSDSFWSEKYHRDPSVLGETVEISGRPATIVGVTPPGFEGITPNIEPKMFLPFTYLGEQRDGGVDDPLHTRDFFSIIALARMRDGVTVETANAHFAQWSDTLVKPALAPYIDASPSLKGLALHALDASRGIRALMGYEQTLTLLQLLMAGALIFCCINVSGLQLARTLERTHEFAVRVAMGANRSHLIRQCLAEALLIAMSGALLALPMTFAVSSLLSNFLTRPGATELVVVRPDWAAFAIAGVFAAVCTLAVGIVPVLMAHGANPNAVLKAKSSMRRQPALASKAILIAQIAVTILLLASGSFYWRNLHRIYSQDLGYHPEHVTEVVAQFQQLRKSPEEIMDLYRGMLHTLNAHAGIQSATVTWITQLTGYNPTIQAARPGSPVQTLSFDQVGPRYFDTLRIRVLSGREFTDEDRDQSHCIVNTLAARILFGNASAMGQKIDVNFENDIRGTCVVVGIVDATKFADIHAPQSPLLYLPISTLSIATSGYRFMRHSGYRSNMVFLIRGQNDEEAATAYRDVLSQVSPGTGYVRFLPMQRQLQDALGSERLLFAMTFFFSCVALLLSGAATLSLLMMRVNQSIPEIAIRVALGATPLQAANMILREMVLLIVAGTAIGASSLRGVEYLTTHYLHLAGPIGLVDVFSAVVLVVLVSFSAGGIPALRAARLEPMQILCRDS